MEEGLTCCVSAQDDTLRSVVEVVAQAERRPVRALMLQALLQLPRIADVQGRVSVAAAMLMLREIAEELPPGNEWFVSEVPKSPRKLVFGDVDGQVARRVMDRFHYLRSARSDGRAYGLHTAVGGLVALAVTSPLDVPRINELLRNVGRSERGARVVSRVFAFENSPRNAISFLLSRVSQVERSVGTTELVTYVNPNMGFTGVSYRASGWRLLGDEPGTTYHYLDGRYVTDRRLREILLIPTTGGQLSGRLSSSRMPLAPLLIFGTGVLKDGRGSSAVDWKIEE